MTTPAPPATAARAFLFPAGTDLAAEAARLILQHHAAALPDLSALTVVVPQARLFAPMRLALLQAAGGALMAPKLVTLNSLAPPPSAHAPLACVLRLAEALGRFRFLFPGQAPLRVAEALYALFDDMAHHAVALDADVSRFTERLRAAYGEGSALPELSREAEIVHRLERALREELGEAIPFVATLQALREGLAAHQGPLAFVGFDALRPIEAACIRRAVVEHGALFISQGRVEGRDGLATGALFERLSLPVAQADGTADARRQLLAAAFETTATARERALCLRDASPGDLALVEATDPEHEAQCADLAVREALLAGARRVAVVCNDRRLARRLRARLERAHLSLIDRGGWALSTSRAAATLDAWLDCAEQDFPWRPFFALLKSGFYPQGPAWAARLEPSAWKLAIAGGASRWREAVDSGDRARWEQLARAAAALSTVSGTHPATAHVDGLLESLRRLGLDTALASDRAGASLMARLQELRAALEGTALRLSWPAFRALLDRALEDASFPGEPVAASAVEVQLLTLEQSAGLCADAVVLTGATPTLLAGAESPFFNAAVRRELGLPTPAEMQALRLARLVAVLQAAPRVRVLYAPEAAGEDALLAAPLLALQAFAAAAGVPLEQDTGLAARAPRAEIAADSAAPEPATRAAPPASATLLARPLSASGHQMLLDCPYRFHARYALGLTQLEAPDTPPDRRDYGERVHRILRAFEEPLDDLPPPWTGPRDATQQPAMAEHLQRLAQAVFAPDLASRPLARFWLQGFTKAIPWLTQQFTEWPQAATRVEVDLSIHRDGWKLVGRADRLDLTPDHGRVVDYKTGTVPTADALATGEAVQLPHYALLAAAADRVEYWDLKKQTTRALDRESLDTLKPLLAERLSSLAIAIERGAALPAHGAATVCERCEFIGVCRRQDQP